MIIKLCIDSAPAQPLEEGIQVVEAPDKISKENSKAHRGGASGNAF